MRPSTQVEATGLHELDNRGTRAAPAPAVQQPSSRLLPATATIAGKAPRGVTRAQPTRPRTARGALPERLLEWSRARSPRTRSRCRDRRSSCARRMTGSPAAGSIRRCGHAELLERSCACIATGSTAITCPAPPRSERPGAPTGRHRRSRHVDRGPGLDHRGVQHGAHARRDAASNQRELLGGQVRLDLDEHRLVDGHLVGERAHPLMPITLLPSGRVPLRHHRVRTHLLAQLRLIAQAPEAVAACRYERRDDPVPDHDPRHVATHREHGPGALVTRGSRAGATGRCHWPDAQIGVADTARVDVHQHVAPDPWPTR